LGAAALPHRHDHAQNSADLPFFQLNLFISVFILLVQLAGGIFSGSKALIADTAHVGIHLSTEIMVVMVLFSGNKKWDIIGSKLITFLLLAVLLPWLVWEAYQRYLEPKTIDGPIMLAAASAGLLGNVAQRLIVRGRGLACESAGKYKLCLDTDIYSSLGVLAGAAIIFFNPAWLFVDTLIAFAIAGWVVWKITKMSKC